MLTRIRPVLLVAACALLCGPGRSQDKTAPPPRPVKGAEPPPKPEAPAPEPAVVDLEQAARQWAAHKGAIELSYHRFAVQAGGLAKARQRLSDHTLPAPARAADVERALKAAQEMADGHAEHVKRVEAVRDGHRHVLADDARQEAIDRAVAAGARPESVQIVEFDEVPIPYLPGNATRIRVKAVGDLALHSGLVSTGQEGSR